jgi:hypothetical protein
MHHAVKVQGGVTVWLHIFLTRGINFKVKIMVFDKCELYKDDDVAHFNCNAKIKQLRV